MATWPKEPSRKISAAFSAALLMLSWTASPVLAAPEHELLCEETHEATLEVADSAFASDEAQLEEAAEKEVTAERTSEASSQPAVRTTSDGRPIVLKRQMYRRDI